MLTTLANFVGGLGLFLVGMWLLTDGLKLAAGDAPRSILGYWTNSRLRGLLAGFFITGLVQSSSAVTVAAIGFANAGLLTLAQAVWV
ncbi:MAG: Na/Pi symporter, partial [Nitrospirota bacterium]